MNITEAQRSELENALDALYLMGCADGSPLLTKRYLRAVAIVRERPAGTRKIRSDAGERRPIFFGALNGWRRTKGKQLEMPL